MPAAGSALSLSSLSLTWLAVKLSSLLRAAKPFRPSRQELPPSAAVHEKMFSGVRPELRVCTCVCVLQRSWVHYCSPLVVCCGCRFVASSAAVWSTIKPSQINREEVGRRVEVSGQCSLESSVQFEIRCAVPSLSVLRMSFQQLKKKNVQSAEPSVRGFVFSICNLLFQYFSRTRKEKKSDGWQSDLTRLTRRRSPQRR